MYRKFYREPPVVNICCMLVLLQSLQNVQVCDATGDAKSAKAGHIKIIKHKSL